MSDQEKSMKLTIRQIIFKINNKTVRLEFFHNGCNLYEHIKEITKTVE